jgi:hypothetical protein
MKTNKNKKSMDMEIPKPYSITEIRKYPLAVAFSIVVGLLAICVGVILEKSIRENELVDKADREKTERIKLYESLIFYKEKSEKLEVQQNQSDSIVRHVTEPFVNKILHNE